MMIISAARAVGTVNTAAFKGETTTKAEGASDPKSTPLTVVWSPNLFNEADSDSDGELTLDEFSKQLSQVGVREDDAEKLFNSFKKTEGNTLSLNEYMDGINTSDANPIYKKLINEYVVGDLPFDRMLHNIAPGAGKTWKA